MIKRPIHIFTAWIAMMLLLCGCGSSAGGVGGYYIYYLNSGETGIEARPYELTSDDIGDQVDELLAMLSLVPEDDYTGAIPENVGIRSFEMGEGNLAIHFTRDYSSLTTTREALLRAAVVKTLTQLDGIDTVSFYILDDPLIDASGNIMAAMSQSSIIDDFGEAQESMAQTTLALYYSNASGDALIREERRIHYNSSVPLEQIVLQYLAMAPLTEGARSVFASGTKVLSITTSDGVCYIDLDASILTQENSISNDVLVYSIVDSLTELDSIAHVRLGVASTQGVPSDSTMVDGTYERDLSLVLNEAEAAGSATMPTEDDDGE